jgi:hypothetical protein
MFKASLPSTTSPAVAFRPHTRLERLLHWPVPRALTMVCGLLAVGLDAQTFSTTQLAVGSNPQDAVLADFDLDGDIDLAVVNQGSANVSVLWSYQGAMIQAFNLTVAPVPVAIASGDIDGDGYPDLAVATTGYGYVSMATNQGDGSFGLAFGFACGQQPRGLDMGDLDGDGFEDVVVACETTGLPLTLLRSLGDGFLATPAALGVGYAASCVKVGDLDGNGGLDLAVGDLTNGVVRILLGVGDGSFVDGPQLPAGASPCGLELADIDDDGLLDVFVADSAGNSLTYLRNLGSGDFASGVSVPCGPNPTSLTIGDFDGDELDDIVVTRDGDGMLSLILCQDDGNFASPLALGAGSQPVSVATADLNGDFIQDLVIVNSLSDDVTLGTNTLGPWVDLGQSHAGLAGPLALVAEGAPEAGSPVSLTVTTGAAVNPPGLLVAGFEQIGLPVLGGTLVPMPTLFVALPVNTPLAFTWPAGVPAGTSLYLQGWYDTALGAGATTATNALRVIAQ